MNTKNKMNTQKTANSHEVANTNTTVSSQKTISTDNHPKKIMKELPAEQQPYEKCLTYGAAALTDAELLAAILRCGSKSCTSVELASQLLCYTKEGGLLGLRELSVEDYMSIRGIGKVKAIQIQCLLELSKRISRTKARDKLSVQNPQTIADYYMEFLRHESREMLYAIMLNGSNHMIKDSCISKGTVNASVASPREVFVEALHCQAVYIILVHNHPSGDPTPSKEDIMITRKFRDAGLLMDIPVIDHIIIGDKCYSSLREMGYL